MKLSKYATVGCIILWLNCTPVTNRFAIPPETTSYSTVFRTILKNNERLQTFQGRGRIVIAAPGRSYSLDAQIIVSRPDTLFLRLEAFWGMDVGWLFIDRNSYTLYLPTQNTYFSGSRDSLELSDFIDFYLPYDQLLNALFGSPLLVNLKDAQVNHGEGVLFVNGNSDLGVHTYTIDKKRGVILESETRLVKDETFIVEKYERFKKLGGMYIPRTIRIYRPLEKKGLTLFYEELKINGKLTPKDFKRAIPVHAQKGLF